MKIALKYGLLITIVLVVWIILVRFIAHAGSDSKLAMAGPLVFNLAEFIFIFAGIRERKGNLADSFTFKEGVKTGTGISFVYALSACLFFLILFLITGPKLLMSDMGPTDRPMWQVALIAYAGLFFGSFFFGIIYSALISFVLSRQRPVSEL
jgi:hypothetical protein